MKIALVNEKWTAGATRCARDMEKFLIREGHEVRYYPQKALEREADILADLKKFSPDVVHAHSYYGDFSYGFIRELASRYPAVFTPHDPRPAGTMETVCWDCASYQTCWNCPLVPGILRRWNPLTNGYFRLRLKKKLTHFLLPSRLKIAVPSVWMRERLQRTELSRFSMTHIPYGIDTEFFRFHPGSKQRLGFGENSKIVLFVSHPSGPGINKRKGLDILSQAFVSKIVPQFPEAMLVIAGESAVPNHPAIRGVGMISQEQLPFYYSAADVLACPSRADNLPYTILEAMACGIPVVGARVGGIPEQIEEGVTGFLVPKENPDALSEALLRLLRDPEASLRMGRAGRAKAERCFSMKAFTEKYETIYREAAGLA